MVRGWVAKGQVRRCGSKPEVCPRGRDGFEGTLEFKSRCPKGHVYWFHLGCTGFRGSQNVLDVVVFEARCWWSAHLEQGFRLWL